LAIRVDHKLDRWHIEHWLLLVWLLFDVFVATVGSWLSWLAYKFFLRRGFYSVTI